MNATEILQKVDHTLLAPCATWEEIEVLCEEGVAYNTASVCIPPAFVERVAQKYKGKLTVCTVIGFPLGYNTLEAKVFEAQDAVNKGADELDMVVNLSDVKGKAFDKVTAEIAALKKVAGDRVLKVIVETCYLTQEEKIALCNCVTEGGADYIKTSTGFGTAGAAANDIQLFRQHIGEQVKIKASGGIRTQENFEKMLEAGSDRIGASAAIKVYGHTAN